MQKHSCHRPIPLPLLGRGRDSEEREMMWLESESTGDVAFLAGGKIKGYFIDVGISGTLGTKMKKLAKDVKDIRKEWKRLNEKAHVRDAAGHLGGWHGQYEHEDDEEDEGGSGSDRSDGLRLSYV